MRYAKCLMIPTAILSLTACDPKMDMQGNDPTVYYAAHPIENRVETRNQSYGMFLRTRTRSLSPENRETLRSTLRNMSPTAVESINIYLSEYDTENKSLKNSFVKTLSHMGFDRQAITFGALPATQRDHIRIDVRYAVVISPNCPDWRTSPVTTYSNTRQGNFKCSQVVNLGLMVADPHDLERGTGDVAPDTARDTAVIDDYRSGNTAKNPSPPANGSYEVNTNTTPSYPGAMGMSGTAGFAP